MIVRHWLNSITTATAELGNGMRLVCLSTLDIFFSSLAGLSHQAFLSLSLVILIIGGGGRHFIGVTPTWLLGAGVTMAVMTAWLL
jgi:hypothetical protein